MASTSVVAPSVKSARRALEILELFAETQQPGTVSEIAKQLGYPQSSTSVLLADMAQLGYLEHDAISKQYRATIRVMLLGGWIQERQLGRNNLLQVMEELRARTQLSVTIGMQRDMHVQYILSLRSAPYTQKGLRAGNIRPVCVAALGKALLTLKSDEEIARIVRRANSQERNHARRIKEIPFLDEMRQNRMRGWTESSRAAIEEGRGILGMLLPHLDGQPPLAIGLGGALGEVEAKRKQILKTLREVCHTLSPR
jgi:DNA-binding IclR family transcriptional regulator